MGNFAGNYLVEIEDGCSDKPKGTKILRSRDITAGTECLC